MCSLRRHASTASSGRLNGSNSHSSGNGKGQGQGCVVVVTSGKGGVGKTTTAASLAYGLAQVCAQKV